MQPVLQYVLWVTIIKEYNDALKAQIDKIDPYVQSVLYTCSYGRSGREAGEGLRHWKKVFFTNSGTEAIEGAHQSWHVSMLWTRDTVTTDHEIIAMNHSFHGRSLGALSVTGNPHYQEAFKPLIGKRTCLQSITIWRALNLRSHDKTCAIITGDCTG